MQKRRIGKKKKQIVAVSALLTLCFLGGCESEQQRQSKQALLKAQEEQQAAQQRSVDFNKSAVLAYEAIERVEKTVRESEAAFQPRLLEAEKALADVKRIAPAGNDELEVVRELDTYLELVEGRRGFRLEMDEMISRLDETQDLRAGMRYKSLFDSAIKNYKIATVACNACQRLAAAHLHITLPNGETRNPNDACDGQTVNTSKLTVGGLDYKNVKTIEVSATDDNPIVIELVNGVYVNNLCTTSAQKCFSQDYKAHKYTSSPNGKIIWSVSVFCQTGTLNPDYTTTVTQSISCP